jgi:hypothetical protein
MTLLIKRMADEAAEPLERRGTQFLKKGALFILGLACLMVSVIFFTIALNDFLRAIAPPEVAAVSVGGLYLAFALVLFLPAGTGMGGPRESGTPVAFPVKAAAEKTSKESSELSRQIDGIIAPIHDALREAGLERERATLVAGAAIAKELTPLARVAFAFVTGIMLGRNLGRRSRQPF